MYARLPIRICLLAMLAAVPALASGFERVYVKPVASGSGNGSTWDDATSDLQYAIDEANYSSTKEVWVAAGVYTPTLDRYGNSEAGPFATFVMKGDVRILGGFEGTESSVDQRDPARNVTILDGQSTLYNVVTAAASGEVTDTARLDGFTIRNGNAMGDVKLGSGFAGGGMTIEFAAPVVANCRFVDNTALYNGGAINVRNPIVSTPDPNDPNGHVVYQPIVLGNVEFINNRVVGTYGSGGALSTTGGAYLANCTFIRNSVTDSYIHGGGGGAFFGSAGSTVKLFGCTFYDNHAGGEFGRGGGIAREAADPNVYQPTFITSCVFWNNRADDRDAQIAPPDAPFASYCDIQGGWFFGADNIDADPQFRDVSKDNLHLQQGSPASRIVPAGQIPDDLADIDYDGVTDEPLPFDLDRVRRPLLGTTMSMGAYESFDCNGNFVPDQIDIGGGPGDELLGLANSPDCNANGIPDECELDSDNDGTIDDCDLCPLDPAKTAPGRCGCGVADTDSDGDGVPDCVDNCPVVYNPDQADSDSNGVGDACQPPPALLVSGCSADISLDATTESGAPVTFGEPVFSGGKQPVSVTSNLRSGNFFSVGQTTVTFVATDAANQRAECSFKVNVRAAVINPPPPPDPNTGRPIDDCPALYTANKGFLNFFGIPTACGPTCLTMISLTLAGMAGMKAGRGSHRARR